MCFVDKYRFQQFSTFFSLFFVYDARYTKYSGHNFKMRGTGQIDFTFLVDCKHPQKNFFLSSLEHFKTLNQYFNV